jgi:amino acid adenylation domain-containing protein
VRPADTAELLHDYLAGSAARVPEQIALVCAGERLSYAELDAQANALANTLIERGVAPGDRVLVFADNGVPAAVSFWAALKANAVVSMINPLTKRDKLAYLLADCRPVALIAGHNLVETFAGPVRDSPHLHTVIVAGAAHASQLSQLPNALPWEAALAAGDRRTNPPRHRTQGDLAAIVYTSGSTGEPKGVMLSHRNMLSAATSISTYLELRADDVIMCALPLAFDYGLYQMILAFRTSARIVLTRSFAFPGQVLQLAQQESVSVFPGVPTMFALLAELRSSSSCQLSRLRVVTNTAAALPVKHITLLQELFPSARIYSMYGLTECKRCTYLPPEDLARKPSSVGIAIPNTELWLVDEHDRRIGPGEIGQLVIRGATVMQGYWEKPEATARRLRPGPTPGEHVLYTGDYCRLDDEGYLYFVGRMDDIIKSKGEKVAPKEVEAVLSNMPGVKECAVIGTPDELLGHAVKAFITVEPNADVTLRAVQLYCRERLESFMVPKYVEIVPQLPKTDTGKIKKTGLA